MDLLIFDFDGIIIDTETPDFESWQEIFRAHGCELPLSAWAHCIGARAGVFDPCAYLENMLGRNLDHNRINDVRRAQYLELVAAEPLRPGLLQYIHSGKRLGLKLAVASSATRKWVADHLRRFGILDAFDCIKTADTVARAKPAPDLFLAVLQETGVAPGKAVAFEDSPNGIRAARDAGIFCVAVPNPVTRQLEWNEADLMIESFEALPLEQLLARIAGQP